MKPTSTKDCEGCPASILNNWRLRGLKLRDEFRRHQLTDRERRLADVILDKSFGWGQPCVIVPQLKFFSGLTGMSVPHVHDAISGLHLKRIIRVVMVKGQANYCIREDTDNWKVSPRVSQTTINETVNLLRELNELPPLTRVQEELLNFKSQPVAKAKRAVFTNSGIPDEIPDTNHLPFLS